MSLMEGETDMTDYRHIDTRRPDGVYATFERIASEDSDASPLDWMEEGDERVDAWRNGEFYFVGIHARADILIVRNGVGTSYTLKSAGLWGIESDSGEEYFDAVFDEEVDSLRADIAALGTLPLVIDSRA